jgi:hypothetical protein
MSININVDINSNINLILHCVKLMVLWILICILYHMDYGCLVCSVFTHCSWQVTLCHSSLFPSNIGWYRIIWNWYWMSKGGHPSPKFLKQVKQRLFLLQYQTQICLRSFIGTSLLLVDSGMLRAIFPLRWLQQQSPAVTPQLLRHCRDSTGTGGYQLRLSSWSDVFGPSMTFISRGECPSKVDAWVAYSHEWRSTHLLRWAMGLTIPGQ